MSSTELPKKLLGGRSARLVVTMGMPALVYRWYFRAHSIKALERNILGFVGIAPIDETLIGSIEEHRRREAPPLARAARSARPQGGVTSTAMRQRQTLAFKVVRTRHRLSRRRARRRSA